MKSPDSLSLLNKRKVTGGSVTLPYERRCAMLLCFRFSPYQLYLLYRPVRPIVAVFSQGRGVSRPHRRFSVGSPLPSTIMMRTSSASVRNASPAGAPRPGIFVKQKVRFSIDYFEFYDIIKVYDYAPGQASFLP